MTDKEIIFSLECCNNGKCLGCHFDTNQYCMHSLRTRSLDLINRQQSEIERLNKENKILSKNADTAFQDGLNEAQDLYAKQIKNEVRAEAIKEFADRLKDVFVTIDGTFECWEIEEHIDNLVKEMVGAE